MSQGVLMKMATVVADVPNQVVSWDLYETIQALFQFLVENILTSSVGKQAPSYHLLFEAALIVWIVRLVLFTKSYKSEHILTEKEKDELIEDWQPEPLVPDTIPDDPAIQRVEYRVVTGKLGKTANVNGIDCLNMATFNFLGMIGRKDIEEETIKSLRKYGVGSCGPRGFYGTVDVHLKLEEDLQKFFGVEEAIIYSYGFSTIASAIPAYSKRGDVIFVDEGCHFAIQKGVLASRSRVCYFKHNDIDDLVRLLEIQAKEDKKNPKKAKVTRRFLIIEGLYMNYGDLCPLPKYIELKQKYKFRIFMDETVSFGTIGRTGRGVTEHFNVPIDEIALLSASLEHAIGSTGGFTCGKAYVIDHQRLSGLGYCFSASTPPMLSHAAGVALRLLDEHPETVDQLRENCEYLHSQLQKIPSLRVSGAEISPIKHIYLAEPTGEPLLDRTTLAKLVTAAEEQGVALTLAAYLAEEQCLPPPSIRLSVSNTLEREDMDKVVTVLKNIGQDLL